MPTPSQMRLPKSKSASEFEDMCADVLSIIYKKRFQPYGRTGQTQHGIDLYAGNGFSLVAQCKNYYNPNNFTAQIKTDYLSATDSFKFKTFIAMTSLDRDTNIQNEVSAIGTNIELFFWDDIQCVLCQHDRLLRKYYPNFFLNHNDIPLKTLNGLIGNINLLIDVAERIHKQYGTYSMAYNYNDDVIFYNQCASMFNAAQALKIDTTQYYIQLSKHQIAQEIQDIIDSIPALHDAHSGIGELICTISNFRSYFYDDDNFIEFTDKCKSTIQKIQYIAN